MDLTPEQLKSALTLSQRYTETMVEALGPTPNSAALIIACFVLAVSVIKLAGGSRRTFDSLFELVCKACPLKDA